MRSQLRIRELEPSDWARFRRIRLRSLEEAPLAFGSTLDLEISLPESEWPMRLGTGATLLAEAPSDVPEGDGSFGVVRLAPDRADGTVGWMIAMWVAPEGRGRGVGDALVEALKMQAVSEGYRRVRLDVADLNADAIRLYARHGFRRTGEVGRHPPPRDHIRWHRRECVLSRGLTTPPHP